MSLPFLERSFSTVTGPFTTLSSLFPSNEAGIPEAQLEDDAIGEIESIVDENPLEDTEELAPLPNTVPSDISDDETEASMNCQTSSARESTITIKEREAAGTGKKAYNARKWLLDHVWYPRVKEATRQRNQFARAYYTSINVLDDFKKTAHKIFPAEAASKEKSTIRTIGYAENLKTSTMMNAAISSGQRSTVKQESQPDQESTSGKKKPPATQRSPADQKNTSGKKKGVKRPGATGVTGASRIETAPSVKRKRSAVSRKSAEGRHLQRDELEKEEDSLWNVEEFRSFDIKSKTILVKWLGYDEETWEPALNLKRDLGASFESFWEPLEDDLPLHVMVQASKLLGV
jgi:hypothetical protein